MQELILDCKETVLGKIGKSLLLLLTFLLPYPHLSVYAWAKAATKPSYSWSEIGSKPTTILGYGITDANAYTTVT